MLPIIKSEEKTANNRDKTFKNVFDILVMDGAGNVQKSGNIVAQHYPRITVVHGTEHIIACFFKDAFDKVHELKNMAMTCIGIRNVFGFTRHVPGASFRANSKKFNRNSAVGFVKLSECRYICFL